MHCVTIFIEKENKQEVKKDLLQESNRYRDGSTGILHME